jgi:hypothetical protein
MMIIMGLTGQMEGGPALDLFGIVLGASLVGWSYWRWQAKRFHR